MKNWKKISLGVVAMAVVLLAVFYFQKVKSKDPFVTSINPAFGEYISSYTTGIISSGSPLRIVLAKDVADELSVGEETSVKLFEFSPSVKGKTVWIDRRTIEFRPAARLQSGQVYEVDFFLSKLIDNVASDLSTFTYSFQVIPQNFELNITNLKPYVKTELKRQQLEGTLLTSDYAEPADVERMLVAQQEGKALKVNWNHTNEGKQHLFTIEEVARTETASMVKIAVDGSILGVNQTQDQEVEVPALNDFKVTNVRVEQGSTQFVVVQFSDPLSESQNLQGLLSLSELSSLDFEIKDNEVRIYPAVRQKGSRTLTIEAGVRNVLNYRMKEGATFDVAFEQLNPAVRFTSKGNILPGTDGLVLPFEAVNLKAVDVRVIRIFEKNVVQFLQVNDLAGNSELRRVGRPVIKKMISLENSGIADLGRWNRFTLDMGTIINAEPGAIYQVQLSFKKSYTTFDCAGDDTQVTAPAFEEEVWEEASEGSYWDSYEGYYYDDDYDWRERDNPCHSSYYTGSRNITRNIIASDLGLIAKRGGDGSTLVVVTDLKTTEPLSGVQLDLYDYQQQLIGSASTGADGKAVITTTQTPFALVARSGNQRGYLKLADGESLSLSNFDVGGETIERGLKGFLYGERGVWRPGDSLYLSFILEDKNKLLPANHPVVFELLNPMGQLSQRLVRSSSENGFYSFATATTSDAPTGNWQARVKVGGTTFTQPLKIEMVKPNRLKINLDFGVDKIKAGASNVSGNLNVKWLHGAPGKNLRAQFEVTLAKAETRFPRYEEYVFDDPSREFYGETKEVFDGITDGQGNAVVNATLDTEVQSPGMLTAIFRGKAFEESGNFSIDRFSLPYYPYESFTGIRVPAGDKARGMLLTDTTHRVDVVTIDADGNPVSREGVELTLYKIDWRWWWDNTEEGGVSFMSGNYSQPLATGKVRTVNGKGAWNFKIKYPEWGRFFIQAYDPVSGHSTGKIVYIDWPGWAGRARNEAQGATMLSFASDKGAYNIGEKANLVIPGSDNGRALISIENGSRVINSFWLSTQKGDNPFSFDITEQMTPNIFVSVTLLQPHAQTINDLPIRMYGVIPIQVENPNTHLTPVITMPDVLEPGKEVTIKVSEQANRDMTFTVAMVDEGLLDLTRFKTPDPWQRFYAREALGVRTWDLYDHVMGAFGGRIERLLAIGGDSELMGKEDDAKANRFKPVVKYFGPYTLSGGSKNIKFVMPQYIGSVKTMVVAGYDGAYGEAEKATPVRKPLMVLATLPRVLGPEEKVKLPVTLFSQEASVKNVKVDVKVSGPLSLAQASQSVVMNSGDITVDFDLNVKSETGIAKVQVTASSGQFTSTDEIEIEVRNPNPPVTKVVESILEPGKAWNTTVDLIGIAGSNTATLEVSSLPPVNLDQRMRYLLQYPYGCIEQTTSSVFPQLYLDLVKDLNDGERQMIQRNVKAGIERLKSFANRDGGFAYWPGHEDTDSWGTTYAGHFLLEAESKGYLVPTDLMKRWKKFQKNRAQSWRKHQESFSSELIQAYRLYTLALAGDAELGAMNRLREQTELPVTAAWMLAAAYVKAGQKDAAKSMIANLSTTVKPYQEMAYSYGSSWRDKAIMLETLLLLEDRTRAFELLKELSAGLSNNNLWMSTQTLAWSLKAVGSFAAREQKGDMKFTYSYGGKEVAAQTGLPIAQAPLQVSGTKGGALQVNSQSKGALFVRVITEGVPARGMEEDAESNITMTVSYLDLDGNPIDPSMLEQGKEFVASVSITNPGLRGAYKNLALNQVFPSGWEINNLRLDEVENRLKGDAPTYQDIRDDRVYTYFDLNPNQRKTFRVLLTASYAGTFYLPAVSCEAMYDRTIYHRKKGQEVQVVKRLNQ